MVKWLPLPKEKLLKFNLSSGAQWSKMFGGPSQKQSITSNNSSARLCWHALRPVLNVLMLITRRAECSAMHRIFDMNANRKAVNQNAIFVNQYNAAAVGAIYNYKE